MLFICIGRPPIAGCGKVLTDEERHYYEVCCEACMRAWGEAIEAWRRGGENHELDAMFDCREMETKH
jgi:hypothetical protein